VSFNINVNGNNLGPWAGLAASMWLSAKIVPPISLAVLIFTIIFTENGWLALGLALTTFIGLPIAIGWGWAKLARNFGG
jgi:hypothetical protein